MKNSSFISSNEALEALRLFLNHYHEPNDPDNPPKYYAELFSNVIVKEFVKGELILSEGQTCDQLFFVAQGFCFGYYTWEGKEYIMNFFRQGEFAIVFHSFFYRQESLLNIKSAENCTLLLLPLSVFNMLFDTYPDFRSIMFQVQVQLLVREENLQRVFRCYTAEERIRFFFKSREIQLLMQHIPQYRIASWLNMAPETFAKIWGQLNLS